MDYLALATKAVERAAVETVDLSHLSELAIPAEPYTGALADYLFDYQKAGVQYALAARQVLIGDEMGLGKTPQAIAALVNDRDAAGFSNGPALVTCPSSLTLNWVRELTNLTDLRVFLAKGLNPSDDEVREALRSDVVVLGYGSVRAHVESEEMPPGVTNRRPRKFTVCEGWMAELRGNLSAVVADESHYLKNEKAGRSLAVEAVAKDLPVDALRILLSGTPVTNRPLELAQQLTILGRMSDTGFASKFEWKKFYCNGRHNGFGWDFSGASNTGQLNARMRKACYVRRVKSDPAVREQLPSMGDKLTPIKVSLDLNGKLRAYNYAAEDILGWARAMGGSEAAARAARAEVLVRMNALRKLAGEAKTAAAVEYITDWLDQNDDRKLVVFATYQSVQQALVEAFDAPAILGGQSVEATEQAKRDFIDGDARVIVVSLAAGREGHTLHADGQCTDVLFVEQGWTPAEHAQAEDRVHRIGQTKDVQPWYLLGAPIDHAIRELVEAKALVTNAVNNGGEDAADEDSIVMAAFYKLTA